MTTTDKVSHKGGCHCKRVRWQVKAPAEVIFFKNRSVHFLMGCVSFFVSLSICSLYVSGEIVTGV